MVLFIWIHALVVTAGAFAIDGLVTGFASISGVFISDIMQFFDHNKSSSISQLIKGKSRYLQKLLKYYNGTTTSVSNVLLLAGVLPIIFALYSKDLLTNLLLLSIL